MTIATLLFYVVARERWGWSPVRAAAPTIVFLVVDLAFFGANIGKIAHGAWFPLLIGLVVYVVLTTWKRGRDALAERIGRQALPVEDFLSQIADDPPQRVPGRAVFMTGNPDAVPPALRRNLQHNHVLHEQVVFLTVLTEETPHVPPRERIELEDLGNGVHRIRVHYGFMEDPDVPHVLQLAHRRGLEFTLPETSFFLGRELILVRGGSGMALWRDRLFRFLVRNSLNATSFYRLPPGQVVELGAQIEL